MKNKLSTTFSQGFQSGTFIRVGENRDLSLFVGKDEKGNYAFDFRGTYVPVRISQSDVIKYSRERVARIIFFAFHSVIQSYWNILVRFARICSILRKLLRTMKMLIKHFVQDISHGKNCSDPIMVE